MNSTVSTSPPLAPVTAQAAPLLRRLLCALYECVLLFGVGLVPGALSTLLLRWVDDPSLGPWLLQFCGFVCFGVYFVWLWSRKGQTLPMQTWRIRLVDRDGGVPGRALALRRYLLAWLWVAPGFVVGHSLLALDRMPLIGFTCGWSLLYGLSALLLPGQQFLHDLIVGTRLVDVPKNDRRTPKR